MAKKAQSFKLDVKNKTIILFTNVEQTTAEKTLFEFYLNQGYTPKFEEKKKGITVKEMRENLKADPDTLNKFNEIYKCKDKDKIEKKEAGFHAACKLYNEWKKNKDNK